MPVLGFRVVLPLLLCLLVIDLVCSTMFSINLQINPQSVEASLHQESINACGILLLTFYYIHICLLYVTLENKMYIISLYFKLNCSYMQTCFPQIWINVTEPSFFVCVFSGN